jgi:hypothetical protein
MAPLPQTVNAAVCRRWAMVIAPMLALVCGCVAIDTYPVGPTAGVPCQVVATWQPQVYTTHDPAHNGADTPTLVGRVYLFGPEIKYSMAAEGALVVDLYDGTAAAVPGAAPLEEFRYDSVTLSKLLRRDAIGWGYTVPFMWSTFRPDVTRVQMKVRFEPAKGTPLYAENAAMAIDYPGLASPAPVVSQSAKPPVVAK